MLDAEKKLLQNFGHDIAEKHLPAVLDAEIQRLPPAIAAVAQVLFMQLKPMMIKALDEEIDKLIAAKGE